MNAPDEQQAQSWPGLLEKLMSVVRSEFRTDLYIPDPDHPILGRGICMVDSCDRSPTGNRLCSTHQKRWINRGRPEFAVFLADPGPPLNGRRSLTGCTVVGCRYGSSGQGLCMRHRSAWAASGHHDPNAWAASVLVADPEGHTSCGLPFCSLWTESDRNVFCKAHETRWRMQGRPDVDAFIRRCLLAGRDRIDFSGLPAQLTLELQYAIQCRVDQGTVALPSPVANWAVRMTRDADVVSLMELTAQQWADRAGPKTNSYPAFLAFARDVVEALHEGTGWDVEYPRDIWRLHRIPGLTTSPGKSPYARSHLRFDRIAQPWLRSLVKRWARLRLSSGLSPSTVHSDVQGLIRLSAFCSQTRPPVDTLADIDRDLLERYLAWLAEQPFGRGAKDDAVTAPGCFFQALRQHGWDDTLPTTAVFFPGDVPPRPPRLTRHLSEHVMTQIEAPHNLDRWPNQEGRLITIILIRCGLRATDACTLDFDCLLHDGQGAPYLRYFNHKMRRESAVPIDEELETEIRCQQEKVTARWPEHRHLFPAVNGNAIGRHPMTYYSYRSMLNSWLATCRISDEHGRPVHLTPHQWRHTFACRLINRDVPQEVIRVLLDHSSTEMTAHYARITDQTVRRRWEQATKVDINGKQVVLDPEGPLAQAQWAKTRYGIATQTLPHGYCGLPVQKQCPHANACLDCAVFLTGPEFLPELREHRGRTLTLIDQAEVDGHTRIVEMNKKVLTNLDKMIGGIEELPEGTSDAG
ncbi:tyrosine-type recombinase/integrase [Rhodococcus artemisiae]|uniref:Tyrosine-type recombinase/integrase n=1 Tax=Rhodococcus artemisiae TaxID=714159 RepID=A0ABU7L8Z4_9NOCA|nr:tyrosine-type recombinase/integrase [Rhodococcus artemisiae]MEE2058021.1 tyrosine-type recombinase/integrase [Rhodococcus artemisiae]